MFRLCLAMHLSHKTSAAGTLTLGSPCSGPFVTFVWGMHEAVLTASDEPIRWIQTVHAHKTEDLVGESGLGVVEQALRL